jgi:hypothetical protein
MRLNFVSDFSHKYSVRYSHLSRRNTAHVSMRESCSQATVREGAASLGRDPRPQGRVDHDDLFVLNNGGRGGGKPAGRRRGLARLLRGRPAANSGRMSGVASPAFRTAASPTRCAPRLDTGHASRRWSRGGRGIGPRRPARRPRRLRVKSARPTPRPLGGAVRRAAPGAGLRRLRMVVRPCHAHAREHRT